MSQEYTTGATAASAHAQTILEERVPLSRSLIWQMQRKFYAERGLSAWTHDQVPSYITNNAFIAESCAGLIAAFSEDCLSHWGRGIAREKPLSIIELGAGTGKFSWLLLRRLVASFNERNLALDLLRYRMTESSESQVAVWRGNDCLAEFVHQGLLEFEPLQAGNAGGHQPSLATKGPLVVIANYVFDSLPQDAFSIEDGQLFEFLLTTYSEGEPHSFQDLRLSFQKGAIGPSRYSDALWNTILEQYRTSFPHATVLFPATTLETLKTLYQASDGRMLVLAADKGFTREPDVALLQGDPPLEFHAGNRCFSQVVNFDALAKYFRARGGDALLPEKHVTNLNVCAFLDRPAGEDFPGTRRAYRRAAGEFGPDDLFALMSWLNAGLDDVPLPQAMALLRLTRWDPHAFTRLFPAIARQARGAMAERDDLRHAVLSTWANHYPLSRDENVLAFYCGVVLLELHFFREAYEMFSKSQQLFGPSATTSYNLGLCCLGMDRPGEALGFMRQACLLDPNFEPARLSRHKLEDQS